MVSFVLRVLFRIQLGKPPLFSLFSLDYSSFTVTFDVLDHSVVISEAWISSGSKFKLPPDIHGWILAFKDLPRFLTTDLSTFHFFHMPTLVFLSWHRVPTPCPILLALVPLVAQGV